MVNCPSCGSPVVSASGLCQSCGKPVAAAGAGLPVQERHTPGMAIAAFILALLPLCITNLIGGILGIVAVTKINKNPRELKGKGWAIASIVIGFGWLAMIPVLGIVAAIAIPNFMKFQARSKQSEAKYNLKSVYVGIKSFEQEKGRPPATFEEIGFKPEGTTRYAYFLGPESLQPGAGGPYQLPDAETLGAAGSAPMAVAVGNIDSDDTLDVWVLDDSGVPMNKVDDTAQ